LTIREIWMAFLDTPINFERIHQFAFTIAIVVGVCFIIVIWVKLWDWLKFR